MRESRHSRCVLSAYTDPIHGVSGLSRLGGIVIPTRHCRGRHSSDDALYVLISGEGKSDHGRVIVPRTGEAWRQMLLRYGDAERASAFVEQDEAMGGRVYNERTRRVARGGVAGRPRSRRAGTSNARKVGTQKEAAAAAAAGGGRVRCGCISAARVAEQRGGRRVKKRGGVAIPPRAELQGRRRGRGRGLRRVLRHRRRGGCAGGYGRRAHRGGNAESASRVRENPAPVLADRDRGAQRAVRVLRPRNAVPELHAELAGGQAQGRAEPGELRGHGAVVLLPVLVLRDAGARRVPRGHVLGQVQHDLRRDGDLRVRHADPVRDVDPERRVT